MSLKARRRAARQAGDREATRAASGLGLGLTAPAVALFSVFFIWPVGRAIWISLFDYTGLGPVSADNYVGLSNYTAALADERLWIALVRNLFVTAANLIGAVGVGAVLGYLLFKKVTGWRFLQVALFIPYILPVAVIALLWGFIYEPSLGLLNQFLQLIRVIGPSDTPLWLGEASLALPAVSFVSAWRFVPFGMIILFAAMLNVPQDLLDAARIDGASERQVARRVVLPVIRPTVWLLVIFIILQSFRRFELFWIMTQGGPGDATTIGTLYLYKQAFVFNNYGYASALGFVIAGVLAGFLPLAVRRMRTSRVEL